MGLEQSWLFLNNAHPRQPKEGNIVSGITQHNSISSQSQICQDSGVGTAQYQPRNAMPRHYFWHCAGDKESVQPKSSCAAIFFSINNGEIQWPDMLIA